MVSWLSTGVFSLVLAVAGAHSVWSSLYDTVDMLHVVGVALIFVGAAMSWFTSKYATDFSGIFWVILIFGFFLVFVSDIIFFAKTFDGTQRLQLGFAIAEISLSLLLSITFLLRKNTQT